MRLNNALIASEAKRRNDFPKTGQWHFAWHFPEFSEAVSGYRTAVGARPKCGNGQVFQGRAKIQAGTVCGPLSTLCSPRGINTASMIATRMSAGTSPTR